MDIYLYEVLSPDTKHFTDKYNISNNTRLPSEILKLSFEKEEEYFNLKKILEDYKKEEKDIKEWWFDNEGIKIVFDKGFSLDLSYKVLEEKYEEKGTFKYLKVNELYYIRYSYTDYPGNFKEGKHPFFDNFNLSKKEILKPAELKEIKEILTNIKEIDKIEKEMNKYLKEGRKVFIFISD